jgi:hypothetical protein
MSNIYDIGDSIRLTGTFRVSGVLTDPTTVTLTVTDPSSNVSTYTYALAQVTNSSTGIYYYDLTVDEAGLWKTKWTGTGTCISVEEDVFYVRNKSSYSSIADVLAFTRHFLDGQSTYNSTTRPTSTELQKMLDRVSANLNMALAGVGLTVPITQFDARLACDDWVTSQAVAYTELTQRGAGANSEENYRYNTFLRGLYKSAAEFALANRLGFVRLGVVVTHGKSEGLKFTGQNVQADRDDRTDTSLEQPVFSRHLFNVPGISSQTTSEDDE